MNEHLQGSGSARMYDARHSGSTNVNSIHATQTPQTPQTPAPELSSSNILLDDFPITREHAHVLSLQTVTSTNTIAEQLVRSGVWNRDGVTVISAREQTAGRGRLDHTWVSESGKSMTASFISAVGKDVAYDESLNGWLQMIAGLSVIDALRATLLDLQGKWVKHSVNTDGAKNRVLLKWPNDIVFHGQKLGGILSQLVPMRDDNTVAVIFGIGINLDVPASQLPPNATSWQLITQQRKGAIRKTTAYIEDVLTANIARNLSGRLWSFGLKPQAYAQNLLHRTTEECWTLGRPVVVHYTNGTSENGFARAINEDASLLMKNDAGILKSVHTGDVGVLPITV